MGAIVELIGTARSDIRTATTGLDGRYVFDHLLAGTYRLRASASLYRPVSTRGLRVGAGVQAVVNLTLANIYSAGTLLPVQQRRPDEPSDDWMWTMRSAASRPVLRLAGGAVPAHAEEASTARPAIPVVMLSGYESGSFGAAGAGQAMATRVQSADGTREASAVAEYGGAGGGPSGIRITADRRSSPWGSLSSAVAFQADPAIRPVDGGAGWRARRVASAETASFGDTAAFEVGSMLATDSSQPGRLATRPFGRVRVFLPASWTAEYAVATDRSLQQAADMAATPAGLVAGTGGAHGVSRIEHGRHQAIVLSRRSTTGSVSAGVYRDSLEHTPVVGFAAPTGMPDLLRGLALLSGALVDGANGTFRADGPGYTTGGCRVTVSQRLTPDTWLDVRFANGAALELPEATVPGVQGGLPKLRIGHGMAAGVAAHSRVRRTGTSVRASYQWQPERMVTPIDAFDALGQPAYLGFSLQQDVPVRLTSRGMVVRVSAGNVLRQGMRDVLVGSPNVATLAQELPTVQAGLGFTF